MTFSGSFSPYAVNIDPGTESGSKLYQRCVRPDCPDDERLKLTMETAIPVQRQLTQDSHTFHLKANNTAASNSGARSDFGSSIPSWRTKYTTDRITHEGREYVWCNRHGRDGSSGLYMSFPHDHDAWLQQKRDRNAKQSTTNNNDSTNTNSNSNIDTAGGTDDTSGGTMPSNRKLQLKASLKKILMTKKGLSGDEVEKIWAESVQK